MPLNLTLLIQRSDINFKSGGDLIQFLQVEKYLSAKDFEVKLIPWKPELDLSGTDVVNLVNDRPLILVDSLRIINKMMPRPHVVISPIHHSDDDVINMRINGFAESYFEVFFSKLLKIRKIRKGIFHLLNVLADVRMIANSYGAWKSTCVLLRNVSAVYSKKNIGRLLVFNNSLQFLAVGEEKSFLKDYQIAEESIDSNFIIPNGGPNRSDKNRLDEEIEFPIIVIGRIEPRKRSLELAKLAHSLGISITFVGAFANPRSKYAKFFSDIVSESTFLNYLGARSRDEVLQFLSKSKVLLNVSFAEVLSLVEMEAGGQEKWIVSSGVGHTSEYISSDQYRTFPHHDLAKGLKIASNLLNAETTNFVRTQIPSWEVIADKYSAMYQKISEEKY